MTGPRRPAKVLRELPVFAATPPPFDTDHAPEDPVALFLEWLDAAIELAVTEPHAMTLSTIDTDGTPDARVLILKDVDDRGWWFATGHPPLGRTAETSLVGWVKGVRDARTASAVVAGVQARRGESGPVVGPAGGRDRPLAGRGRVESGLLGSEGP
jgi:pyridoxamine 5'-phosphate oxidase